MATAFSSIYGAVAIFAGEHWVAEEYESKLLATRANAALQTLPSKTYVFIKSYTENIAPWVAFVLAIYAVTMDKWEKHAAIERQKRSAKDASTGADNGVPTGFSANFDNEPRFAPPYVGEHFSQ